jgi:hypothetical protein
MNTKQISWVISIILLVAVTTFIWTKTKEIKDNNFKYGKEFNRTRDSLKIPKIEPEWITHESSPTNRYWASSDRRVTRVEPMHLSKESKFDEDKILAEEDRFHYETDDSLAYRIIYRYTFDNSTWDCEFILYRKGKYPPTESWELTLDQADSALNKWGLSR